MFFSEAFPVSEDEFYEEDPDAKAPIRLERKRLLEEFPNHELLAVHSVALFLAELVEWADTTEILGSCQLIHFVTVVTI
jgi:hypothetical protein